MLHLIVDKWVAPQWRWFALVFLYVAFALILSFCARKVGRLVSKRVEKKKGRAPLDLAKVLDFILIPPFLLLIWTLTIVNVLELIATHYKIELILKQIGSFRGGFIVIAVYWMLLRWISSLFQLLRRRSAALGVSLTTVQGLHKLCSTVVSILSCLIVFQIFGFNILPLLTFGGIGVAGIAFAAQDMISNFFGGTMLHFTKSFAVGDYIVIPSSNAFEGTVKKIGWYTTIIEDNTKRPVYFPNALFGKTHIINESRRSHRCIKEYFLFDYAHFDHIEALLDAIREAVKKHPQVDTSQQFSITLHQLGDRGLEVCMHIFVYMMGYGEFMQVREEVFLALRRSVADLGTQLGAISMPVRLEGGGAK